MTATPEQFTSEMAREVAALESFFSREEDNLFRSAQLQGKPWYGIGLESSEVAEQKDDANKKGIVRRMIDAIVAFCKKIVEKIRGFFARFSKVEAQKNQQFVKTYKGPSDEQLAALVKKFSKEKPATEGLGLEKGDEATDLDAIFAQYGKVSGKHIGRKEASLMFKKDKLDMIIRGLSEQNTALVGAMTDANFSRDFKQSAEFCAKMINRPFHADHLEEYLKFSNQVHDLNQKCQEVVNFMAKEDAEKRLFALGEWVLFGEQSVAKALEVYPEVGANFEFAGKFMEALSAYVAKLGTLDSDLAVQKLKVAQKVLSNMTAFVSLASRVAYLYSNVVKAVRM